MVHGEAQPLQVPQMCEGLPLEGGHGVIISLWWENHMWHALFRRTFAQKLADVISSPSAKAAGSEVPEEKGQWGNCWRYQRNVDEYNCWLQIYCSDVWRGIKKWVYEGVVKWGDSAKDWFTCPVGPLLQKHVQVHFLFCTVTTAADRWFLWSSGKTSTTPPPKQRK